MESGGWRGGEKGEDYTCAAPDHDGGLDRQHEQVGQRRHDREAAEVVGDQRQGQDLRGQGDDQRVVEEAGQRLGRAGGQQPGHQPLEPFGHRRGKEDQAEGGQKAELEADVPQRQRVERGHHQAGDEQRDERQAAPVQVVRQGHQQAHDCGAHHGGVGADEQGVEDDPRHDRIERPALADHPAEGGRHDAGDDRDVKSRDDDDVAGARVVELIVQVPVDAGFDAQEDAGQQRGLRLRQQLRDDLLPAFTEPIQRGPDAASLVAREDGHFGALDQRVYPLASEIGFVVEVIEDGRRFQPALHHQAVAIAQPERAIHREKCISPRRPRRLSLLDRHAFGPQPDTLGCVPCFGRPDDRAHDSGPLRFLGRAVVEGEVARGRTRVKRMELVAQPTQKQEQQQRRRYTQPRLPPSKQKTGQRHDQKARRCRQRRRIAVEQAHFPCAAHHPNANGPGNGKCHEGHFPPPVEPSYGVRTTGWVEPAGQMQWMAFYQASTSTANWAVTSLPNYVDQHRHQNDQPAHELLRKWVDAHQHHAVAEQTDENHAQQGAKWCRRRQPGWCRR